jgi:FKBP-type peptidyl-prolyl cis-trans isomerase 2
MASDNELIGKRVSFQNEDGDCGWNGTITEVDGDKVFVDGPEAIRGWMPIAELEVE